MLRLAPAAGYMILLGPVLCGLLATVLPAFGYMPSLGGQTFSLNAFHDLFATPGIDRSILTSFLVGLVTTAVSLTVVMIFMAGWLNTRWFAVVQGLISPLLSIPHAAAAFGLAFLIAPSGWIMRLISPELTGITRPPDWLIIHDPWSLSMILGLVVKEIPFLFLVSLAALPQARPQPNLQLAASLGYGRVSGFLITVWPRIYAQIRLAVFAVIVYSSSVVDVALILGPNTPPPLAVRLLEWMSDPVLTLRFKASAGAVVQFGISAAALLVWIILERLGNRFCRMTAAHGIRMRRDGVIRFLGATAILLSVTLIGVGMVILALWSIAGYWQFPDAFPTSFTLRNWHRQIGTLARPFSITLALGILSTLIACLIVVAALERESRKTWHISQGEKANHALWLLYLPLLIPQASFVFGLQLFFLRLGLNTLFLSLVIVHVVFVLPYVFLSFSDPWRSFDPRLIQIAQAMGKSRNRIFWRIRLPMLLRPLLVAAAVGFAVSIGQYLPTVLIGAGRWPTITTEAVALSSGGDRRLIGIYAFIQMALPFAGFFLAAIVTRLSFRRYRGMQIGGQIGGRADRQMTGQAGGSA